MTVPFCSSDLLIHASALERGKIEILVLETVTAALLRWAHEQIMDGAEAVELHDPGPVEHLEQEIERLRSENRRLEIQLDAACARACYHANERYRDASPAVWAAELALIDKIRRGEKR